MFNITRYRLGLFIGLAILIAFPVAYSFASSPTGYEIDADFQNYYEEAGGLPVFGYAVSEPGEEHGRLVQYFERQRLELHPEHAGTPYVVLLGHLGLQEAERRGLIDHEAFQPRSSGNGEGQFFEETGHNLGGLFREYWNNHGLEFGDPGVSFRESLALFGYPISEEFVDPDTGLVTQYFERARFEHHPDNAGSEYEVLLGHLGNAEVEFLRANGRGPDGNGPPGQRDRNNLSEPAASEPTATPAPEPTATPVPQPTATPQPEPTATPVPQPTQAPAPTPTPVPDNSSGGNNATPGASIQQMVDNAASGATVRVPAGIYRETVTINKPITLIGEPGAEIRGSDVWTEWSSSGGQWVSNGTVPNFWNQHGYCESNSQNCKRQEQVFIDGEQVTLVDGNPGPWEFAVNNNRQVVLGQDPTGHTVEVSTRSFWVVGRSESVTIDSFKMKHAANQAQTGAINNGGHDNYGYDNWTIQNNRLSHAHGANVSLGKANNLRLLNNEISFAGQLGVHGGGDWFSDDQVLATNITVEGNRIHNNNTAGYRTGWEAGGLKLIYATGVRIKNNEVYENRGSGLWCDVDCDDVIIRGNHVHHNSSIGISYELSKNGLIEGNVVYENAPQIKVWGWGAGILVQNSRDTIVRNNVVAWNGDGIIVMSQNRGSQWPDAVGNYVHNNDIAMVNRGGDEIAMGWLEDWDGALAEAESGNRGENNRYFHWNPEQGSWAPFRWAQVQLGWNNLNEFNQMPGENDGTYLSDNQMSDVLSGVGVPARPE